MNTLLRDLSIIWVLIHCCVMFMLLYESRYPQRKTNIITAIFMVPLIVVNLLNVTLFGIEVAGNLIVPCCVLPSLIFFLVMAKHRDTRFLFSFCLVDTAVLEVVFATNLLDTVLGVPNYVVMFASRLALLPLLEFFMVKYLKKPYHYLQREMKKGWGVFSLLSVLFYAALLMITYYPTIILDRPEYFPYLFLMLALVPVMYATVFTVLWKQTDLLKSEEQNRVLELQMKMARERLDSGAERERSVNILRHDMKHHFLLLDDYIKSGRYEEAERHIAALMEDIDKSTLKNYCDNHAVNVVLSHYDRLSGEAGAQLKVNVTLPRELTVSETDLAVVLSNGLDNALHAARECEHKAISVKCFVDGDKLYLEIKNPIQNAVTFDGPLPKAAREKHGFGTRSMAAIVEKYEGAYSFTVENGYFVFRCSI